MDLTTGQIQGQTVIDIDELIKELATDSPYKIFVDTIDENNDTFVDGEVLVVHVARSEYNAAIDPQALVRERVEAALRKYS